MSSGPGCARWAGSTCRDRTHCGGGSLFAHTISARHPARDSCAVPARCARAGHGYAGRVRGTGTVSGPSQEVGAVSADGAAAPGTAEVVRFDLLGPPVLSRSAVLRDDALRHDTARQRAGWSAARVLVVDEAGRVPVAWTGRAPEGPWGMDTDGTARVV